MNTSFSSPAEERLAPARSAALTAELAAFVSALRFEQLPAEARAAVRLGFSDCVGVMLAGAREPVVGLLAASLGSLPGEVMAFSEGARRHPAIAAWLDGTAAHALDFDDAALRGHPSAVLVPAILAEAQALGCSGADVVTAYVAGYETWAELAHRDAESHHRKGWHPTGIFGPIGAAAACASLHRLDPERTAQALALAASRSSGLMANFGSMAKPLHAGQAAQAGVMSARLAVLGATGSADAIEHPQGFLAAVSPSGRFDGLTSVHATRSWHILEYGLNLKQYPMCYCTHRPIDAMLGLRRERGWSLEDIAGIEVSISARNATVLRNHAPQTGLAAKFSIEFAMAAALVAGRVGLAQLTDAFVRRPDVQRAMGLVTTRINPDEDPESGYAPFDHVVVRLTDGSQVSSPPVADARGAHRLPMSRAERFAKFDDCARAGCVTEGNEEAFAWLEALDTQRSLDGLLAWRAPPRGAD